MAIRRGPTGETPPAPVEPFLATPDLPARYRVQGRLRRRSGRAVLIALDREDDSLVAVKAADDPETAAREGAILAALDHPQVVRLRERLERDGAAWLVLEYVAGDSLEARLRASGALAPAAVRDLLRALAEPVAHIHARGFLHRDLKPANVLIRPDGTPVVADLGAAVAIQDAARAPQTASLTDGYAAPEQYLADGPEGPWTDVYGLAAIGYRALTGEAPPAAPDRLDGVEIGDAGPGTDRSLGSALQRALALEPEARPASIEDFIALLDDDRADGLDGERMREGDRPDEPGAADPADEGAPTIRIRRRARAAAAALGPDHQLPAVQRPRRGRTVALALALLVLAGGLGFGAMAARPLYDRHLKTTWVVDGEGDGDVATIGEALERAGEGATILIRPGTYAESLVLDQALHLAATDQGEAPMIAPPAGPCLITTTSGGSVAGLDFRGGETAGVACLAISGGDLQVRDARITALSGPAVEVRAGAAPELRDLEIEGAGIVVREGSRPVIGETTIADVAGPGLVVRSGAMPEIVNNRIERSGAVIFAEGAGGIFEGNRIEAARANGVEVASGATPEVVDNDIVGAEEAAVFVYAEGGGSFENNRIAGSTLSGIVLAEGAAARLSGNRLSANGEHGILILDGSTVALDQNLIEGSRGHGIAIAPGAEVELGSNRLQDNASGGLFDARIQRGGGGGDT